MSKSFKGLAGVTSVIAVAGMTTGIAIAAQAHEGPLFESASTPVVNTPNASGSPAANLSSSPATPDPRPTIYVTETPKPAPTVVVDVPSSSNNSGSNSGGSTNSGSTNSGSSGGSTSGGSGGTNTNTGSS